MYKICFLLFAILLASCNFDSSSYSGCLMESDDISRATLPDEISSIPKDFIEAIMILDSVLTNDEKLVIKCAKEEMLENRNPFPEIWGWAFSNFRFFDKNSSLGKILVDNQINPFNGDKMLAFFFHRYLNGQDVNLEETYRAFRIRNETNGRVMNIKLFESLTPSEYKRITALSHLVDSMMSVSARPDIEKLVHVGDLPEKRKAIIENRNLIIHLAVEIRKEINHGRVFDENLQQLKNLTSFQILEHFDTLSLGERLIVLEEIKLMSIAIAFKAADG